MPFTETLKREVRQRSAYTCCICRTNGISVEIHHILPQKEGGPDDFDNAACLCSSCHSDWGGNPEKRSRIKEMRDWWYEIADKMYKPRDVALLETISTNTEDLPTIKRMLNELVSQKINMIGPMNAPTIVSSILSSTSAAVSGVGLRTLYDEEPPDEPTDYELQKAEDLYIEEEINRRRGK